MSVSDCQPIRPLVLRVHEREASPEEAMRVARHLSDCTACRILLARERRLASMLAEELEDLPVGEDFVQAVMATLPKGPPPRRRRYRGLKLASIAGMLGLLTVPTLPTLSSGLLGNLISRAPAAEPDALSRGVDGLFGVVQVVVGALELTRLPLQSPELLLPIGAAILLIAFATGVGALTIGLVAARAVLRPALIAD